ncbi:glucans biosynthesis protein [Hartmannibacter diazotrophicus]|uniref:Glucans biosynthesis protein n=1 Tax=Hartmannibacter diazotrophicus TaxID=1482074 RepID=A0A2C9D5Z0_9HYPH|nr:acyltransferase [Hartmannibacter diazotrophicus]SON55727.1 glucans biosynthesis protein [Hartmannibacter diazotrophicus]
MADQESLFLNRPDFARWGWRLGRRDARQSPAAAAVETNTSRQLVSIQILRAFAALMVVIFHVTDNAFSQSLGTVPVFMIGNAGVDIFFVISGFVMYLSTRSPTITPARFWEARIVRIVPLYYLATLTFLAVVLLLDRLPADFSAFEIVLSGLFIPFRNSLNGQEVPLLGVGWTLNYEAMFYLVVGLAIAIAPLQRKMQIVFIASVLCVLVVGRFLFEPTGAVGIRMTSPILLEFLSGMMLGVIESRRPRRQIVLGAAMIAAGVALMVFLDSRAGTMPRTIGYGLPAVLIVQGFILCEGLMRHRSLRLLRWFGDASYSIYLVHGIVIYAIVSPFSAYLPRSEASCVVLFVLACGAGLLCYEYVEQPLLRASKSVLSSVRRKYAAAKGAIDG